MNPATATDRVVSNIESIDISQSCRRGESPYWTERVTDYTISRKPA